MKGLILAGGSGTRLRPITYTSAKQLVPVANKPILFYGIESLVDAGITEIGFIVGDTEAEVRQAVGDGSAFGAQFTFIRQSAPLGLAHAVLTARDFLATEAFVMYLGDNLIAEGIRGLVAQFAKGAPAALVMLAKVPHPERFGVARFEGERLVGLVEKPANPPSDLALVGVYMFSDAIHSAIDRITPSPRGELEITDAIQRLIDDGREVDCHVISGWWKDTGQLDDLLEANRIVLDHVERRLEGEVDSTSSVEGKVVVEAGARIINGSVVRGPAVIGAGTVVDGAYVGPFSAIGANCMLRSSEIEHSVVMEDCTIDGAPAKVESSLLGRGVSVRRSQKRPHAIRLMLGDHSEVDLV